MEGQGRAVNDLIRDGVAAAKAGRRSEARALLARAADRDPDNVQAWLWLSGVVEAPQDQERCLRRVLELEPGHTAARKGLEVVQKRILDASLEAGIAAAEAGDLEKARDLLMGVIERDEENVMGWLWLARVVDSPEDREVCYENVLTLDPRNAEAREALAELQGEAEQAPGGQDSEPLPPPEEFPVPAYEEEVGVVGAGGLLVGEAEPESEFGTEALVESEAPEDMPGFEPLPDDEYDREVDPWDRLEDEHRCPFCLAITEPEDRHCPECRKKLWIGVRRREDRSTGLWILIAIQIFQTLVSGAGAVLAVYFINVLLTGTDFPQLFSIVLESQYGVSPEAVAALTDTWIYVLYVLFFIPFIFSAILLVGLYLRWPIIFYLLVIQAALGFLSSVANFIISSNTVAIIPSVISALLSLGYLFFVLQLEDDFIPEKRRVLLRLDRDVRQGPEFLRRGKEYASLKMWALSALHFRHAAAQVRTADAYLALVIACMKLEEYDLAERALAEARAIAPGNAQVAEFSQMLEDRRREESAIELNQ